MARSYSVTAPADSGNDFTVSADKVVKDADGDLVFYEISTSLGATSDRETARFKPEAWASYYEESDDE